MQSNFLKMSQKLNLTKTYPEMTCEFLCFVLCNLLYEPNVAQSSMVGPNNALPTGMAFCNFNQKSEFKAYKTKAI